MDQDEAMFGAEVKPQKPKRKTNWTKIGVVIVSTLVGLSHIGMIGTIANRRTTKLPEINLPVVLILLIRLKQVRKDIRLLINQMTRKSCIPLRILKLKVVS
ncbi:MAG: hypothetical protein CM15mV5_1100 [uncultured marine virus]|nr:MAG: hypothetical protein CM15mV5_1100 [uncultured marine virus]